ncbi:asparaginase [Caenimonas aquaedulcis]|uniref:asparaginase n=1 Tax=Caenimonas aquaedulcis TaxID=2793270 RepID=UPI001E5FFC0F|nr:asparaginase [Caenimonas aquaedulcis]
MATGGTIAGRAASAGDNIGYTAGQVGVEELLDAVPGLRDVVAGAEQVAQVDSKDMSFEVWRALALRCAHWLGRDDIAGLVITHGTDTLEETAFFLQAVLSPAKPVVLTCAMRPATAMAPDGPQNMLDAAAVALHPGAQGVTAVCAGVIHSAADVAKRHTYRLDAFSSGDAGAVGYVEEGRVRQLRAWPVPRPAPGVLERFVAATSLPRVEIVTSHAGAGGALVNALVQQGVDGLVVAATGNGTVHRDLEAALLNAQAAGTKIVRTSRCAEGVVLARGDDRFPAAAMSAAKARIALVLELLG